MSIRRRIALLIDPSLHYRYDEHTVAFQQSVGLSMIAAQLAVIAKATKSLDTKTTKRRPRIIECRHPELHPELDEATLELIRLG